MTGTGQLTLDVFDSHDVTPTPPPPVATGFSEPHRRPLIRLLPVSGLSWLDPWHFRHSDLSFDVVTSFVCWASSSDSSAG
jgi:hypothetical protein